MPWRSFPSLHARAWLVGLFLLSGCGPPPSGEISGTVHYAGKPIAQGTLTLISDDGKMATCPIRDGNYTVVASAGHVMIAIDGGDVPKSLGISPIGGPEKWKEREAEIKKKLAAEGKLEELKQLEAPFRVPAKYGSVETSGQSLVVKPGKQTHNIDLPAVPDEADGKKE